VTECERAEVLTVHLPYVAVSLHGHIEAKNGERNKNQNEPDKQLLNRCTEFQAIEGHGVTSSFLAAKDDHGTMAPGREPGQKLKKINQQNNATSAGFVRL
jgi:hypothetical protein